MRIDASPKPVLYHPAMITDCDDVETLVLKAKNASAHRLFWSGKRYTARARSNE
jgi:hypothetical protein